MRKTVFNLNIGVSSAMTFPPMHLMLSLSERIFTASPSGAFRFFGPPTGCSDDRNDSRLLLRLIGICDSYCGTVTGCEAHDSARVQTRKAHSGNLFGGNVVTKEPVRK
jgi:hypothetical protein